MNIKKKFILFLVQLFVSNFLFCQSQSKSPIKIWKYSNDNESAQHFQVHIWETGLIKILNLDVIYMSGKFNSECWETIDNAWYYQHGATCRYNMFKYKIEVPDPIDFIPYSGILDIFPQTIEFDIEFESQIALFNIPGKPDFKGTNEIPIPKELYLKFNFKTMSGEATFGNLKSTKISITDIKRINTKKINILELWGKFLWETDAPDCCE